MNSLIPSAALAEPTMGSLEISCLVESRHDDVKRSIKRLADRGVISLPPLAGVKIWRERREETVSEYRLIKRDSYVVVAQLSPEFTARLVDRWQELEAAQARPPAFAVPQSLPEALRLAAELAERNAETEARLAVASPKAEALDRLECSETSLACLANLIGLFDALERLTEDPALLAIAHAGRFMALECAEAISASDDAPLGEAPPPLRVMH